MSAVNRRTPGRRYEDTPELVNNDRHFNPNQAWTRTRLDYHGWTCVVMCIKLDIPLHGPGINIAFPLSPSRLPYV